MARRCFQRRHAPSLPRACSPSCFSSCTANSGAPAYGRRRLGSSTCSSEGAAPHGCTCLPLSPRRCGRRCPAWAHRALASTTTAPHTHTQHTPRPPRRYLHLNRLHDPPPPADAARLRTLLARFLRLRRVFDLSDFLTGWFLEVPLASIPLGNVLEFVAYGFHAKVSWRGCSGRRSSQGSGRRGFRDCGCPNPWPTSV